MKVGTGHCSRLKWRVGILGNFLIPVTADRYWVQSVHSPHEIPQVTVNNISSSQDCNVYSGCRVLYILHTLYMIIIIIYNVCNKHHISNSQLNFIWQYTITTPFFRTTTSCTAPRVPNCTKAQSDPTENATLVLHIIIDKIADVTVELFSNFHHYHTLTFILSLFLNTLLM